MYTAETQVTSMTLHLSPPPQTVAFLSAERAAGTAVSRATICTSPLSGSQEAGNRTAVLETHEAPPTAASAGCAAALPPRRRWPRRPPRRPAPPALRQPVVAQATAGARPHCSLYLLSNAAGCTDQLPTTVAHGATPELGQAAARSPCPITRQARPAVAEYRR